MGSYADTYGLEVRVDFASLRFSSNKPNAPNPEPEILCQKPYPKVSILPTLKPGILKFTSGPIRREPPTGGARPHKG